MTFQTGSPEDTIWAVVVGAVLATAGGFVATQLEAILRRRERERSAALMFGEILSALETITEVAGQAKLRGEPYGSITLRLIRAALREIETYERNRASLYDLHGAEIRIRIHVLMVQVTLALGGVSDASARIAAAQDSLEDLPEGHARVRLIQSRLAALDTERESAFGYVLEVAGEIASLVKILEPIARVDFASMKRLSGNPFSNSSV